MKMVCSISYTFTVLSTVKGAFWVYNDNSAPKQYEPQHHSEISNNVVCATSKGLDQPVHTRSLIRTFGSRLDI